MNFSRTFSPVPESDLTANERSSNSAGAVVCNCSGTQQLYDRCSLPSSQSPSGQPVLTLCDGARPTGLSEAIALAHGTTETNVHEPLCGRGQRRSSRQHYPHVASQQLLHLAEQQAAKTDL